MSTQTRITPRLYIEPASSLVNADIVDLIEKTPFVRGYMQGAFQFERSIRADHRTVGATELKAIPADCLWEAYRDCQVFTSTNEELIDRIFAGTPKPVDHENFGKDFFYCRSFDHGFNSCAYEAGLLKDHQSLMMAARAMHHRFLGRTLSNNEIHFVGRRFKKGDIVTIRPEFQDAGDDGFTWLVRQDEDRGAVDVSALRHGKQPGILPVNTVRTCQIEMLYEQPSPMALEAMVMLNIPEERFADPALKEVSDLVEKTPFVKAYVDTAIRAAIRTGTDGSHLTYQPDLTEFTSRSLWVTYHECQKFILDNRQHIADQVMERLSGWLQAAPADADTLVQQMAKSFHTSRNEVPGIELSNSPSRIGLAFAARAMGPHRFTVHQSSSGRYYHHETRGVLPAEQSSSDEAMVDLVASQTERPEP